MLDFIINPIAGGKGGKKILDFIPKLKEFLKRKSLKFALHFTKKKGEAKELTDTLIKDGATDIVCIGGDGTLHEVINGFHDFDKVNLGIIPLGTGNDFANALKIPTDPVDALKLITEETPKYTDFMQMPTVRGLNVIGAGLDVEVLKKYERLKKKTKFGYTKCLLKTLFTYKCVNFKAKIGEKITEYHSFISAIANGHCFGGGLVISPEATPIDGKLNFVAVDKVNKFVLIKLLIKLMKKKINTAKQYVQEKVDKITIIPATPHYTVNVDGELYDDIPFEVEIVSNKLKVYRV